MPDPETLAELHASMPRRIFGVSMLGALAVLLGWLGATAPTGIGARFVLLIVAVLAAYGAVALWRATAQAVFLTEAGLVQSDGRILAAMDEIAGVERGLFAVKPSNGFLVRLNRSRPFAWAPGLWWRWGRRLGVGGMTRAAQAKTMADILTLKSHGAL
ncbi:hypothetical protein SAMN04488020_101345 [Palleronia marisminoris]|uniref:Uncharacterized protein n=1 Tax=Palleronia marisminoris TaxID=315423 RepID=A0A1Y5RG11_9RHOB|nr:hypothetical protein [Palleronia marisminoris]SFG15741.1 hypothetical protein SAMN04488020_101345 [Palleronia marisminoris]SLN15746.1 hypothetical protein PAM7066_00345 [Palleronia marisminoris]